MIGMALLGVLLVAAAGALAARAVALPELRSAERARDIGAYGFGRQVQVDEQRGLREALTWLANRAGTLAVARIPKLSVADTRRDLLAAGQYRTAPETFIGYRVLLAIVVPLLLLWAAVNGGKSGGMVFLEVVGGGLGAWVIPNTVLRRRAQSRHDRIEYDLPDLIDLLVVTVEAGLGFNGSLQNAARRLKGPLGDEIRLTLQEQTMGLGTNTALSNMLARCDTPSMRSFVRSVLQGETLGVSIGTMMRNLAVEMRKRRRATAEEKAQKAPLKMLFPLILLIFPSMFIVLLGPAIISVAQTFAGTGGS